MIDIHPYIKKVQNQARYFERKHKYFYSFDDLFSAGMYGLYDASIKNKTKTQETFWSYAIIRVKGAIQDEIRFLSTAKKSGDHIDLLLLSDKAIESIDMVFAAIDSYTELEDIDAPKIIAAIRDYVSSLVGRDKQIMSTILYFGYAQVEAARILNIQESTVAKVYKEQRALIVNFVREKFKITGVK